MTSIRDRLSGAWAGRISGCQLGKPVELMSMQEGQPAVRAYLDKAAALPLRDYVPALPDAPPMLLQSSCREQLQRSEPDDDINYSVLALMMLEDHGAELSTEHVARAWLNKLPVAMTFTAERAAFKTLLNRGSEFFGLGAPPGFDVTECADNEWNDWIGAQIRADVYGWVCPGQPARAAALARADAALSHRGEGIHGAAFVAALGAAIPEAATLADAVERAKQEIPADSDCAAAVALGISLAGDATGGDTIRAHYDGMSPVHTVNNLALVVWALLSYPDDFDAAVGEVVTAGLDTDCNGATVGGLWGLQGKAISTHWTERWQGRVVVTLAGVGELQLSDLVERTARVAERIGAAA